MTRTFRRSGGLAVLAAATAIGLAACGGTSPSPHVASLPKSSGHDSGTATTGGSGDGSALPKGSPTQLVDEWGACMRRHGDTGQADPTIGASKVIDISWNPATPGGLYGTYKGGQGNTGPGQYCRSYLAAAQTALGGDQAHPRVSFAKLLKYSECMRANGIADFPDPTASGGLQLNIGGDTDPSNPSYRNAAELCARKTGARAFGVGPPPPGTIELNGGAVGTG